MRHSEDLAGQRFGHYLVLQRADRYQKGRGYFWLCRCDCGNEREVRGDMLKGQQVRSCGCGLVPKAANPILPAEERAIVGLFNRGLTVPEIATEVRRSRKAVTSLLRAAGFTLPTHSSPRHISDEQRAEICRLWNEGLSSVEIGRRVDRSHQAIKEVVLTAGLPFEERRRRAPRVSYVCADCGSHNIVRI